MIPFGGNDYDDWIISNCEHCRRYYDLDENGYPECEIMDEIIGGHGDITVETSQKMGLKINEGLKDFTNSKCTEFIPKE